MFIDVKTLILISIYKDKKISFLLRLHFSQSYTFQLIGIYFFRNLKRAAIIETSNFQFTINRLNHRILIITIITKIIKRFVKREQSTKYRFSVLKKKNHNYL